MIALIGCGTLGARTARNVAQQLSDTRSEQSTERSLLLFDHDQVEERNVGVQLYEQQHLGQLKAHVLAQQLPKAYARAVFIDHTNLELLQEAEVIIDCTDNLATRLLLNQYCVDNGIPLVHAAASQTKGFVGLFTTKPCLACIYQNKISLEACRGADLNLDVVEQLAQHQARLAMTVLAGEEEHEFLLVTPTTSTSIAVQHNGCPICLRQQKQEIKPYYITYCTQAGCMSAKPVGSQHLTEGTHTYGDITAQIFPNGEIHFSAGEVDELERLATTIFQDFAQRPQ